MARPERFELPTLCFEGRCSIQLSYGRVGKIGVPEACGLPRKGRLSFRLTLPPLRALGISSRNLLYIKTGPSLEFVNRIAHLPLIALRCVNA